MTDETRQIAEAARFREVILRIQCVRRALVQVTLSVQPGDRTSHERLREALGLLEELETTTEQVDADHA